MKKNQKSDYLILALICLIILNIGAAAIGLYSNNQPNYSDKSEKKVISLSFDKVLSFFNIDQDKVIKKIIVSIFPMASGIEENFQSNDVPIVNIDDTSVADDEELDEEVDSLGDIIIDNLDEYESLIIVKDSENITVENIPEPLMLNKLKVSKESPYILLYHTHATESYSLASAENYRSSEKEYNMVKIGSLISKVLEAGGHKIDHVQTFHDLPSYNQSYSRSLNTIQTKNQESSNFKVLLDVHRDAVADNKFDKSLIEQSTIEVNGKKVATFSLVIGPDSKNKEQVLNFAKYIKAVSDAMYPGLCTKIIIKPTGKYNQYLSDYSALIEVGYNFNTMEEASESATLIGDVLNVVLNSILE